MYFNLIYILGQFGYNPVSNSSDPELNQVHMSLDSQFPGPYSAVPNRRYAWISVTPDKFSETNKHYYVQDEGVLFTNCGDKMFIVHKFT